MASYKFSVSLRSRGMKIDVFITRNTSNRLPQRIFYICKLKKNFVLKYTRLRDYREFANDVSNHFLIKLKTAIYRHIMTRKDDSKNFEFVFEYVIPEAPAYMSPGEKKLFLLKYR